MATASLPYGASYQDAHGHQSEKSKAGVLPLSSGFVGIPSAPAPGASPSSPGAATSTAGHVASSSSASSSSSGNEISLSAQSPVILPSPGPTNGGPMEELEVDEAIIQALRSSKERLYMLKLGEDMEVLIKEKSATQTRPQKIFTPTNPYQRMLIHRSCTYYRLYPEVDTAAKTICVVVTTESRIPSRRMCELVPETSASMPSFKIMRRNTPEQKYANRQSSTPSVSSTVAPEVPAAIVRSDSQSSEVGSPSVDGSEIVETDREAILRSLGLPLKQSKSGNGATTPRKTIQEREAEYAEARNRIFQDFAEKEKAAAKLRADREREREVTEMHRELADAEAAGNLHVPGPVNGMSRSSSPGKPRDRISSNNPPQDPSALDVVTSIDPGLVAYPTLYDPDNAQKPTQAMAPPLYPMDPSIPPYDTNSGAYSQGPPMTYSPNNPYAYHMPPPGMPMGYAPYPAMPNQPGPPPGPVPMGPPMMGMVPYPYYAPPPSGWSETQGGYPLPPVQEGHPLPPPPDHGYNMYGPPPNQSQQPAYWAPAPHPQAPSEMPPPSQYMAPPHPNGQPHYPTQMQFYNPAISQQPYPHPPPPGQGYPSPPQQYQPNFNPGQQRPPPPNVQQHLQQPRQIWSPNLGRRDLPGRNIPPMNGARPGPSRTASANGQNPLAAVWTPSTQMPNGQTRVAGRRGSMLREVPESPRHSNNATSLIATPMSQSSTRSRNSSISSQRGGVWYSPRTPDGFTPLSPSGSSSALASVTAARMSLGGRRRSGSQSGSMSENISVAGDESGAITPLDETASLASSSMSSTGSTRTFTSTSSKHPSLPPRPDWSMGALGGLYPGGTSFPNLSPHSGSNHSSVHGRSGSSSNSSQPSHSRNHSFQSQNGSPYSAWPQSEFPPLPGGQAPPTQIQPRRPMVSPPTSNGVWNGGLRNSNQSSPMPPIPQGISPLLQTIPPVASVAGPAKDIPPGNRFGDPDPKYSRPPAKGSGTLFDHKQTGKAAPRPSTPVGATTSHPAPANNSTAAEEMETRLAQLHLADLTPSMANSQQTRVAASTLS